MSAVSREVGNSAALGAALRAWHAVQLDHQQELDWNDIVSGVVRPLDANPIKPDPRRHEVYRALMDVYQACERDGLAGG